MIRVNRPPRPLSPHQEGRRSELAAILTVFEVVEESWSARVPGVRGEHLGLLLAATRWLCSLALPEGVEAAVLGPPLLARHRHEPSDHDDQQSG